MKNVLMAYSDVVKDNLYDFIPKTIKHLFIDELIIQTEQNLP